MKQVAPKGSEDNTQLIPPPPHMQFVAANAAQWARLPAELRERPQWALAGPDKAPRSANGISASSTAPGTWCDFDTACQAAAVRGCGIGFVLHEDDPFTCIDIDVKDAETHPDKPELWSSADDVSRYQSIVNTLDSYTERSRSGKGVHIWVRAEIGRGRRRDGVEVYSQERFIICTGDVYADKPVAERQEAVSNMAAQMRPAALSEAELRPDQPDDDEGWYVAQVALDDPGEMGRLMRGDWEGRQYPSHSEADFALMLMFARLTEANGACRNAFRLSRLSKRADKPDKYTDAHLNLALRNVRPIVEAETFHVAEGQRLVDGMFWPVARASSPLDALRVDWDTEEDADVPDIIDGLVADEEVTLLGGHGGIGKSFLALQIAAAVSTGQDVLHRPTRQCRVLYYSAEDGRKRLMRRLRSIAASACLDRDKLRENLMLLDASEVEPLYGETVEHREGNRVTFNKVLGPRADFANLQRAVEAFDPQLVIIDGASDTFDGNEIARREVRAFIKMLRRVHPTRKVGVLLLAHIDRASARGHTSNDDGYAGSGQWHNSCRRRLFLQQEVKKDYDDDSKQTIMVLGDIILRVMKNQDGPPDPDITLSRGPNGLWQVGSVDLSGLIPAADQPDYGPTLLSLIGDYYRRGTFMSTSLAPQATSGVYATLSGDPQFPPGLNKKRTAALVRQLKRDGLLVEEQYKRGNRGLGTRWAVADIAVTG